MIKKIQNIIIIVGCYGLCVLIGLYLASGKRANDKAIEYYTIQNHLAMHLLKYEECKAVKELGELDD